MYIKRQLELKILYRVFNNGMRVALVILTLSLFNITLAYNCPSGFHKVGSKVQ